jgi:hypothetical protein
MEIVFRSAARPLDRETRGDPVVEHRAAPTVRPRS